MSSRSCSRRDSDLENCPHEPGKMVADYTATVFSTGYGYPAFALAYPQLSLSNPYLESIFTKRRPGFDYDSGIRVSAAQDKQIPGIKGTRVWQYYDQEHKFPIHPGTVPVPPEDDND